MIVRTLIIAMVSAIFRYSANLFCFRKVVSPFSDRWGSETSKVLWWVTSWVSDLMPRFDENLWQLPWRLWSRRCHSWFFPKFNLPNWAVFATKNIGDICSTIFNLDIWFQCWHGWWCRPVRPYNSLLVVWAIWASEQRSILKILKIRKGIRPGKVIMSVTYPDVGTCEDVSLGLFEIDCNGEYLGNFSNQFIKFSQLIVESLIVVHRVVPIRVD